MLHPAAMDPFPVGVGKTPTDFANHILAEPGISSLPILLGSNRMYLVSFVATIVLFKDRGLVPKVMLESTPFLKFYFYH